MTDPRLIDELHQGMSARPHSARVWAIRRDDGLYFSDVTCEFWPLHPLVLFESRSRAEGRMIIYLDSIDRARCAVVEFELHEVAG